MTLSPPKYSDILLSLWTDHDRLEQLRADIHSNKKDPCPRWKFEVWVIQVKAQLANTALEVLKDSDIDDLKQAIEEIKEELKKNEHKN